MLAHHRERGGRSTHSRLAAQVSLVVQPEGDAGERDRIRNARENPAEHVGGCVAGRERGRYLRDRGEQREVAGCRLRTDGRVAGGVRDGEGGGQERSRRKGGNPQYRKKCPEDKLTDVTAVGCGRVRSPDDGERSVVSPLSAWAVARPRRSASRVQLREDLGVAALLARVRFHVRPAHDPLLIDEEIGAIREKSVFVEHAVLA